MPTLLLLCALLLRAASSAFAADEARPLVFPDRVKADVVLIVAHPDDEGAAAPLLARWALEEKKRVVAIYLTSGDLGTDRVGRVQGPAFGYMRLTELHWTLDRLGVTMFHTLARPDLSRNGDPKAVIEGWDRDRTLRELVRYLRVLRPDRLLTWFPGPAASHDAHMAAGALALLACRSAADATFAAEQIGTEGLRPWTVPRVDLIAQADKVGYETYPVPRDWSPAVPSEVVEVNAFSPALGRRYTDIAREAMKEQRSVGVAQGLARGGPFDAPLRLLRAWAEGEPAGGSEESPFAIRVAGSRGQAFVEEIANQVRAPAVARSLPPEVLIEKESISKVRLSVRAASSWSGRGRLGVPDGWAVHPVSADLDLKPGAWTDLEFSVTPPGPGGPSLAAAALVLVDRGGRGVPTTLPIVLSRSASAPKVEAVSGTDRR